MKNNALNGILALAALGAGACLIAAGPAAPDAPPRHGVAGSFLCNFDYGGTALLATAQINADGTFQVSDQTDFGAGGMRNAPAYGAWTLTGPRTGVATALSLCFDAGGTPIGTLRLTFTKEFDRNFNISHGVVTQRFYTLAEDPLDAKQGSPLAPETIPYTSRRIDVR